MLDFGDLRQQKMKQALDSLRAQEEGVYRQAIEKRFGEYSEENAKKCTLVIEGRIKRLKHGDEVLCEVHPLDMDQRIDQSNPHSFTLTHKYKVF